MQKICLELGTKFTGIHYTESNQIPLPNFDESKEKLRFEILERKHFWASDEELEKYLNNN